MFHSLAVATQLLFALLTLGGLAYYASALLAARQYARQLRHMKLPPTVTDDGLTILKPLRGYDAGMYSAFRSHCTQHYAGDYEILFGVASLDDAACPAVARLQAEFPERNIRLLVCPESLGANGKVSTLAQMLPSARHGILVINDSDISVPPLYLQHIADQFADTRVGMVTALYRGQTVPNARGQHTLWSRFEALTVSTEFLPGVLLAKRIEKSIQFALGATLAIRRPVLEQIGGLLPLADRLADDYELGVRTARSGYRIALTPDVVATSVPPYNWHAFAAHQIRWLRTVRDARPAGYFGVVFTFGTVWALLAVAASAADPWSLALLSLSLVARYALALSVGLGIAGDRQVIRDWWLIVPRDIFGAAFWLAAYAGHTVEWRGLTFHLQDGRISPQ